MIQSYMISFEMHSIFCSYNFIKRKTYFYIHIDLGFFVCEKVLVFPVEKGNLKVTKKTIHFLLFSLKFFLI